MSSLFLNRPQNTQNSTRTNPSNEFCILFLFLICKPRISILHSINNTIGFNCANHRFLKDGVVLSCLSFIAFSSEFNESKRHLDNCSGTFPLWLPYRVPVDQIHNIKPIHELDTIVNLNEHFIPACIL